MTLGDYMAFSAYIGYLYNPLSQLAYACNGSQVTHSWVAGEPLLAERQLTRIDLPALTARVNAWRDRIAEESA